MRTRWLVVGGAVGGALVAGYFPALVIKGTESKYPTTRFSAGDVIKVYTKVTTTGTTVRVTDVTKGVTKQRTGLAGLRHRAQRDTLARTARQARRARTHRPGHPPTRTPRRRPPPAHRAGHPYWHGAAHPAGSRGSGDVAEGTPEIRGGHQLMAGASGQFRTDRRTRS
jgi:hypothetical protein